MASQPTLIASLFCNSTTFSVFTSRSDWMESFSLSILVRELDNIATFSLYDSKVSLRSSIQHKNAALNFTLQIRKIRYQRNVKFKITILIFKLIRACSIIFMTFSMGGHVFLGNLQRLFGLFKILPETNQDLFFLRALCF